MRLVVSDIWLMFTVSGIRWVSSLNSVSSPQELMAHGETADSADYGPALVRGIRFLAEAELDGRRRSETQIVACALCGASVAVRNPNVRTAAERALAAIGENRSVESGRDWRGLLAAWEASAPKAKSHDTRLSSGPAEADPVADACIFVLRLLAE